MTPQLTRARHPSRVGVDPGLRHGEPTPRVLLKPPAPKTGYVDGAWWPYTDDLMIELAGLLAVVAARLGPVLRVEYPLTEWSTPPGELVVDERPVRLDWHGNTAAHTIDLIGPRNGRLVLLVVPADTAPGDAYTAMTAAATTNDTSTAVDLLRTGIRRRRERRRRATAARRWAGHSASPN